MELQGIFEMDKWITAYLIFKAMDFITGFAKAYKIEGFKSRRLRDGLVFTLLELISVIFAGVLDWLFGFSSVLLIATKMLLVGKEALSIVENLGQLGVPIADIVKDKVQDLNKKGE